MIHPRVIASLRTIVGDSNVHAAPAELVAYSYDATFAQRCPDVAVTPGDEAQVSAILALANSENLPVIPRGAGTNLAGATVPDGGIVLSLTRMNRILKIDGADTIVVAQPGVVTGQLQAAVERLGLFYPPDPASLNQCTIGGNVACNAGGPHCLKYGVTKDYVRGMTVVWADGSIVRLGGKVIKNASGYRLEQLLVGSEGTLGVITEVILRLLPLPPGRCTATAVFSRLEQAGEAVTAIIAAGILPATLELMDGTTIGVVEDHLGLGLPREADAMLILEQDGGVGEVEREVERMAEICRSNGASEVNIAVNAQERDSLWRARRAVSPALGRKARNKLGEDLVVPRSQLPEMLRRIRRIAAEEALLIPVFGHAGDGNLHPNILFDSREPADLARVERAAGAILAAAVDLGGAISGEHGIGTLKSDFLADAVGPAALSLMRQIKRLCDPKGLLNPNKMFPSNDEQSRSGFLARLPSLGDTGGPR